MAQRVRLGTEVGTGRSIHNSLTLEKRTWGPERLQILSLPVTEYFGGAARVQLPEAHTGVTLCGEMGATPRKLGAQKNPSENMQYSTGSKSEKRHQKRGEGGRECQWNMARGSIRGRRHPERDGEQWGPRSRNKPSQGLT